MDLIFDLILREETVLITLGRRLGRSDFVHLVRRIQLFPGDRLAFIFQIFVLRSDMTFRVIDCLKDNSVLAVHQAAVKAEFDLYLAV